MMNRSEPRRRFGDDDERLDPEEEFRRAREAFGRRTRGALRAARVLPVVAVVVLGLWLASGVYVVNPGEQGVVRHFGR